MMVRIGRVLGASLGLWLACCGGGVITSRDVDTPTGSIVSYGAPANTTYSFESEPELNVLRLHLFRAARCPVFPTDTVLRRTETLKGDKVIHTEEHGKVQIAKPPTGEVACDVGYGRDVDVSLVLGNAVHRIGTTDAYGYVSINLSTELREKLYGAGAPPDATVRVFPPRALGSVDIGTVSLASLRDFEAGVNKLLAELEPVLAKGTAITGPEIERSYQLYEQLRELAYFDARVRGTLARFWELFYGRKREESTQNLQRNLKALEGSKALLSSANLSAIPLFMQAAVTSQSYDPRAVDWSNGELFEALRRSPQACTGFDWRRVQSYGFGPSALLAVDYLRFAQGDDFWGSMSGVCSFVTR
jgi:hypothetical protein